MTDKLREALELIKALDVPVNIVDVMDSTAREAVEIAKAALAQQDAQAVPQGEAIVEEFSAWLNERRGMSVAWVFHEVVAKFRAAVEQQELSEAFRAELDKVSQRNFELRMENAGLKAAPALKDGHELAVAIRAEPTEMIHKWRVLEILQAHTPTPPEPTRLHKLLAKQVSELHTALEDVVEAVCAVPDTSWPDGFRWQSIRHAKDALACRPVQPATTPPAQRVALTDEEISRIYAEQTGAVIEDSPWALNDFVRAVIEAYEKKNGIK